MADAISLTQHILQGERQAPQETGEISGIMTQIALVGQTIARDLSQSGLIDLLGSTGQVNVQGEEVQKLDQKANESFVRAFESSEVVRTLISEEMEKPLHIVPAERTGKYALFFDPLDGSSNIDVNAPLGSIFSIHRILPFRLFDLARIKIEPAFQENAVNVGSQTTRVAGGIGTSCCRIRFFQVIDEFLHTGWPFPIIPFIDAVHLSPRGHLNIRGRQQTFTTSRFQGELVDSLPRGVNKNSAWPEQDIAGCHLLSTRF